MHDHAYYTRVALRLRRWAIHGTWRRMVQANAGSKGADIPAIGIIGKMAH